MTCPRKGLPYHHRSQTPELISVDRSLSRTSRRKPQAREINRQYREFGKKVCKLAWRRDAVSQYRRLLLEVCPDLKPKWRVVEPDDEPLSELRKKIELELLIEEELQAEAVQGASTSY